MKNPEEEALEEARGMVGLLSPQEFEDAIEYDTEPFLRIEEFYSKAFPEASEYMLPAIVRADMLKQIT